MDNLLEGMLGAKMSSYMGDVLQRMLESGADSYRLKGKRVLMTDTRGTTRKIPYEDFFKFSIKLDGNSCVIKAGKKDGVDVMTFLLLGMCLSLNSLGLYEFELQATHADSLKYLSDMADFVSKDFPIVSDAFEYNSILSRLNKIFLDSSTRPSIRTVKRQVQEEEYKSLYFAHCFGTSGLRPNTDVVADIFPYMLCLSTTEEGRKRLIETFCCFSPLISFSGAQIFSSFTKEELEGMKDSVDVVHNLASNMFFNKDFLSFGYEKIKLNEDLEISDIDGVCLFLAYIYSTLLFFGDDDGWFLDGNKENFARQFNRIVGNDCVRDYLLDGDINSLINFTYKDKPIPFEYGEDTYSLNSCTVYTSSKFFNDLEHLNIDLEIFSGCASFSQRYVTYNDCIYRVTTHGGSKLVNTCVNDIFCLEKEHSNKVNYYKKRNSSLSDKNKELAREIKSLKSQLDKLSEFSTSVREAEYFQLKKDYALAQSKVATLEEKCNKLENKYSEVREDMHSLISSLETEQDEVESKVSLEEMIEFLNGFNLCIIGGRFEMADKLHEMGLHNFTQYLSSNEISRLNNYDFMISMTRFMSHNMFYNALSKLGSDRDKHCYYNGTNLNSLISVCYEFINKYFEIV